MIPLPPKRFECTSDAKFDPIRHHDWFRNLGLRRKKIPLLRAAYAAWERGKVSQKQASEIYCVDERELRDYATFVEGKSLVSETDRKALQHALDEAYLQYCAANCKRHIRFFISSLAPFYRWKARPLVELWETDPTFWPTGYKV